MSTPEEEQKVTEELYPKYEARYETPNNWLTPLLTILQNTKEAFDALFKTR